MLGSLQKQLQEPLGWHRHKCDLKRYQRDSCVLSHINYGMFGCWQSALELGLVYVVHIGLPQFGSVIKHDEAMRDVFQALADHHKLNVWDATIDMHCSDISGQRVEDWNTIHMVAL